MFGFIAHQHLKIFSFLRQYGCRLNEACGLLWENVEKDKGYFTLSHVVNRDRKLVPFTKSKQLKVEPIVPEIMWVFVGGKAEGYVFTFNGKPCSPETVAGIWKRAMKKAHSKFGTPIVSVYPGIRHSFATQRLEQGFTLDEVSAALGHKSPSMTKRYAEYTKDKLSKVIRGYKEGIYNKNHNHLDCKTFQQASHYFR